MKNKEEDKLENNITINENGEFNCNIQLDPPDPNIKAGERAMVKEGWVHGTTGGSSNFMIKLRWQQWTFDTGSDLKVAIWIWSKYNKSGTALSGSNITIDGNRSNFTKGVSGAGDVWLHEHKIWVGHSGAINKSFSGAVVWNGRYDNVYYNTISGSGTAEMNAISQPKLKMWINANGWKQSKDIWVYANGWKQVKNAWINVNGSWKAIRR